MMLVIAVRVVAVGGLVALWFFTQKLISQRTLPPGEIGDKAHQWLASVNRYLNDRVWAARLLLVTSSLGVDFMGLTVIYQGIFGPSFRPVLGLTLLLVLRQLSQYFCALPSPSGMIWKSPGIPSIFVTYGVTNDLFFSGHTAVAVYGALILSTLGGPGYAVAGAAIAIFEMLSVLALRAHWGMDVYAGFVTAVLCFIAIH